MNKNKSKPKQNKTIFKGFAISVQGARHKQNGLPLQDASQYLTSDDYAIVAVADGHGGEKYIRSQQGAELAVQNAIEKLKNFIDEDGESILEKSSNRDIDKILKQLEGAIIHSWCYSVIKDYNNHPLSKDEESKIFSLNIKLNENLIKYIYGTTLLYACILKNCWFISQIGDGRAIYLDMNDNITDPIIYDDRLHCGITTSICSTEAGNDFRHAFGKGDIKSIVIATDGLTDSYLQDSYAKFIHTINENYHKNTDETVQAVKNWLPIVSERGSRDDISIGFISKKIIKL